MGTESSTIPPHPRNSKLWNPGEGVKLFLPPKCTALPPQNPSPHGESLIRKLSSPWNAKLSSPTQGRCHAFFFEMHSYPSPHWGEGSVKLASPKMQSFHCHKSFPIYMEGFFHQNAKPPQIILYFYWSMYCNFFVCSLLLLFFSLCMFLFPFFAKLEILPQRRKFIPQRLGRIIEE